jgi:hypothetical protein
MPPVSRTFQPWISSALAANQRRRAPQDRRTLVERRRPGRLRRGRSRARLGHVGGRGSADPLELVAGGGLGHRLVSPGGLTPAA